RGAARLRHRQGEQSSCRRGPARGAVSASGRVRQGTRWTTSLACRAGQRARRFLAGLAEGRPVMNTPHVPSLDGEATRQAEEDRRETMGLDLETLSGVRPQPVRYLVPNLVAL